MGSTRDMVKVKLPRPGAPIGAPIDRTSRNGNDFQSGGRPYGWSGPVCWRVGHMRLSRSVENVRKGQDCVISPTGSPRSSTAPFSTGRSYFSATSSCFSATGRQRRYVYSQKECVSAKQYVCLDISPPSIGCSGNGREQVWSFIDPICLFNISFFLLPQRHLFPNDYYVSEFCCEPP